MAIAVIAATMAAAPAEALLAGAWPVSGKLSPVPATPALTRPAEQGLLSWRMTTPVADSTDPDAALLQRAGGGDAAACALLVDRHLPRVHRFAQRLLGNPADAEEIAQEVFLRVWQQAPRWRSNGAARFSTWLYRVAQNLCLDRLRQRRPQEALDEDLDDDTANVAARFEQSRVALQVRDAVALLPARQRAALALCHDEGLSNPEAAAVLEISVEALESLLARARRTLRSVLAPLRAP